MILVIQPAYGDAWTRRQFVTTLDHPVLFTERGLGGLLTQEQLSLLAEVHPDGRAPFWGGTRSQATKIVQLERGDLVLLTGQRHVRGVGEVGAIVDNQAFAGGLWPPHPRRCSFELAFSLSRFRRIQVAYGVLQAALGTSERDHFQAMRLIRDRDRVEVVDDLINRRLL